jgi:hypothetical protein
MRPLGSCFAAWGWTFWFSVVARAGRVRRERTGCVAQDTGIQIFQGGSPPASEQGRARGLRSSRRPAPVFVRIPHLTSHGAESLWGRRSSSGASGDRPNAAANSAAAEFSVVAEITEPRTDSLPSPQRRVSPVEYALRRMRHEAPARTSQTMRNVLIVVAILVTAAGLTIWMTQGVTPHEQSSGPASALRSPSGDALPGGSWDPLQLDMGHGKELEDRWAWGSTAAMPGGSGLAPDVDSWPPTDVNGQPIADPGGPAGLPPSVHLSRGGYSPGQPQSYPGYPTEQTPVANLIHIEEAPPLRR